MYLLGVNHEGGVGGESFKALLAISWVEEYGKVDDLFDRYIYEFNFVAFFFFFFFLSRYATKSKAFSKVTLFLSIFIPPPTKHSPGGRKNLQRGKMVNEVE